MLNFTEKVACEQRVHKRKPRRKDWKGEAFCVKGATQKAFWWKHFCVRVSVGVSSTRLGHTGPAF